VSFLVDTRGISKEMEGKRLRISFADGETAEIKMHWVMIHDCHDDCNGFIFYIISTDRAEKYYPPSIGEPMWGHFEDVASVEVLGD
jgi:hypothetical protein